MSNVIMYIFGELKKDVKLNKEVLKSFEGVRDDEGVPLFLVLALTSAFGTPEEIAEITQLTNEAMSGYPGEIKTLESTLLVLLAPLGSGNEGVRALVQQSLQGLVPRVRASLHNKPRRKKGA